MIQKTVAIVQARMDSTRLPGKSLARIGKWSMIELVMKRANRSSRVDKVLLATSGSTKDDVLASHVERLGFPVFRGSEDDVLARFYGAAKQFNPTMVVRITGDCPLISPKLIDRAVDSFIEKGADYLALSIGREKEVAYPRGFDVEVASFESLSVAVQRAEEQYEREHVMPYLHTRADVFAVEHLRPTPEYSRPDYRLCVDTQEDLELILRIHSFFKDRLIEVDFEEIIQFLDGNPHLAEINRSVKQKHFKEVNKDHE